MAASVKTKNRILVCILVAGMLGVLFTGRQLNDIAQFNKAVAAGASPDSPDFKFESRYAEAYAFAINGRYQDATQLFNQLMESEGTSKQIAAVQYNLGNIFFIRGLMVNRNGASVKDEAEYLLNQARLAYQQSLRLDNRYFDARYNLDRVLSMLPKNPSVADEQDELGIVMGNIPTGLP